MAERQRSSPITKQVIEQRALALAEANGNKDLDALFADFVREQGIAELPHRSTAYAAPAQALLRYPPELAAALSLRMHSLHPTLGYDPFGTITLALSRLDTLALLNSDEIERTGQILALLTLAHTPSPPWTRMTLAATPIDLRIRVQLERALRSLDPETAQQVIVPLPPEHVFRDLAWLRRVQPGALPFAERYLLGVMIPPTLDAGLGLYLGYTHLGDWLTGWLWGLTIGISVAVFLQQRLYRPKLRELVRS